MCIHKVLNFVSFFTETYARQPEICEDRERDEPVKEPDMAASSVDTWKRRSASSTSASFANGSRRILANDSATRTIASSCLSQIRVFKTAHWHLG